MESFSNVASGKKDLTLEDFPALGKSSESLFVKDFEFKAVGGGGGPRSGFVPSKSKEQDKFGLLGLIDLVRMTNEDLSTLSLGTDLSALGLNLNGSEHIYQSFMSPFSDQPMTGAEPEFTLSLVYSLPQVTPKMASYSDETLFYIFYAFPRDAMQEAAAQELYGRSWRYHKELKLWLSKDAAMVCFNNFYLKETTIKGPGCERGVYVFFDPSTWTRIKKEWILYYDQIEERGEALEENEWTLDSLTLNS